MLNYLCEERIVVIKLKLLGQPGNNVMKLFYLLSLKFWQNKLDRLSLPSVFSQVLYLGVRPELTRSLLWLRSCYYSHHWAVLVIIPHYHTAKRFKNIIIATNNLLQRH
jgi:hypothetical protein